MSGPDYKTLYLDLVGRLEGWAVQLSRPHADTPMTRWVVAGLRERMAVSVNLPRRETSASIAQWQRETFGEAPTNWSSWERAHDEFNELADLIYDNDGNPKAVEEIADIAIVLSRIVAAHGRDLQTEIDRKMAINRTRKWRLTGDGHGQHVEDEP